MPSLARFTPISGVRAAVQRGGRDDVVAGLAQREQGHRFGGLAEAVAKAGAPALDRRDALLEGGDGGDC
jgi:hypothetical protein